MAAELPDIVRAPRTDPIYNCHSYLTKVPVGAIKPFIETLTRPGEVVADPFAGSGMTGIAAVMSDRRAELSDISVLGSHIATGYLTRVDHRDLRTAAEQVVATARAALGDLYTTRRASDGKVIELIRSVWSFVYVCPKCIKRLVYIDALMANGGTASPESCPGCTAPFSKRTWKRAEDVPVTVVVDGPSGKQVEQPIEEYDRALILRAQRDARLGEVPSLEIHPSREMYSRSGLGKTGVAETKNFFSPRNAIALHELWKAISGLPNANLRKKLSFSFTAILGRASRRYQWGPKRPLNAQNQTYYVAPVYYEWNVFDLFLRKVEAACRSDDLAMPKDLPLFADGEVAKPFRYQISSADSLSHLKDESVDYVFTDPPFGSNIFYSDMNLFHEAWLGKVTNERTEAVIYTTGKKKADAASRYAEILEGAFRESFRVLKPGKYLSVVFGNSSGAVWSLLQKAIRAAGFEAVPAHIAILDKGQRSVKGLNSGSEGVVTLDLILTVQKPARSIKKPCVHAEKAGDARELLLAAVDALEAEHRRSPSYLYVAAIREAIRQHMVVDQLHYADVLIALRNAGLEIDPKTGLLNKPVTSRMLASKAA